MYRWALASLIVLGCGAVLKPPEPDRRLELRTGGSVFESSAGFRFASLPEPRSGVVRLDVRYPVGSVDDPPGKEGLAHLVEHLLFDAEIERDGRKTSISAELGRLALTWNAETDTDYTTYQVTAEPAALDEILGLEVDRLARGCSAITPAIFTREREVVLNELRQRQGAGGAELRQLILDAVYPEGHPYRRTDSVESVAKLDFKDVCDFLAGPYRHGIATVVASGAVEDGAFRKAVEHRFATVPKRAAKTKAPPPVIAPVRQIVHIKADVDEALVAITWPLPPSETLDARRLAMVYDTMPFFLEQKAMMFGWGHSAFVTVLGGPSAPVLAIVMTVSSPSHLRDVEDSIPRAFDRALLELGEDKDTREWRVSWQTYAEDLLAGWENLAGRNDMAATELESGSQDLLIGRIKDLTEDTPEATRDVAKKWLDPERARYLSIEPTGKASTVTHVAHVGGGEAEHMTVVDPALADKPLPAPRSLGLATTRYRLDNGLSVILWPHGTASLVHGRLVIDAGAAHDPPAAEGLSELLGGAEVLEDQLVYGDREISTRVDDAVRRLAARLRPQRWDLSDEDKRVLKSRLRLRGEQEARTYEEALASAVYGARHPYARPLISDHSVDTIHSDLIADWARSHVVPKNATLIVTGQFDLDLVKRHIAYDLDQVSAGEHTPPIDLPGHAPERTRVFGESSKPSPSIELDVLFAGGAGIDSRYGARLVLAQVLSTQLESLRGERALTYGFGATFEPRRSGGLWRISGKADAERAGEATTALLAILDTMRRDPESYRAAFVLARQKVLESLAVGDSDSAVVTSRLVMLARFGLADSFYDRVAQDVAKLTLPELHAFMIHELPAENQVFGAFGDHDAITAARAAAK
jgi:zinc protease